MEGDHPATSTMVREWLSLRSLINEVSDGQDPNLCFVCQKKPCCKRIGGIGICKPCESEPVE